MKITIKDMIYIAIIILIAIGMAYGLSTTSLGNVVINGTLNMTTQNILNVTNITGENGGVISFTN